MASKLSWSAFFNLEHLLREYNPEFDIFFNQPEVGVMFGKVAESS